MGVLASLLYYIMLPVFSFTCKTSLKKDKELLYYYLSLFISLKKIKNYYNITKVSSKFEKDNYYIITYPKKTKHITDLRIVLHEVEGQGWYDPQTSEILFVFSVLPMQ